jgi:formamidopyrimidine-DNA glycosylase
MPELPDVERFRDLVAKTCFGRVVARVLVEDRGCLEATSAASLQRRLKGASVRAARRHGKHLFVGFGGAGSLAMHFGTNGSLQYTPPAQAASPYRRLRIAFSDGDSLDYLNPRRIGRVRLVDDADAFIAAEGLGPDALDSAFDEAAFAAALAGRKQAIKAVLMDQARMAGIGNIYADEILFQARIHPAAIAASLTPEAIHGLFTAMKFVLQTAVACGAGAETFVERLPANFLLPARHRGGRCPRCGGAIATERLGGRTSYFCPRCQPLP